MKTVEASKLRQEMSDALNTVAYTGERIAINRHGKTVAVLVSIDDFAVLQSIEDRIDIDLAKQALKEKGAIPWTRVKKELGLK